MKPHNHPECPFLTGKAGVLCGVLAVLSFHLAWGFPQLAALIVVFLWSFSSLRFLSTPRRAFYAGLAVGLAVFALQLFFFWGIFGPAAIALWIVLSFWFALFLLLARLTTQTLSPLASALSIPFLWTGLEYFRGELYYLRFPWLSPGYSFPESLLLQCVGDIGVYGFGFVLMALVTALTLGPRKLALIGLGSLAAILTLLIQLPTRPREPQASKETSVAVAGMQLEFPATLDLPSHLDKLILKHPEAKLLVLSEYTLDGPVPEPVKAWCRQHERFLIIGGKKPIGSSDFENTAFVVSPAGEIVFEQVKSVPIQFFQDGRPAQSRRIWESPWGKIGICICYDLSYTKVTDDFIKLGAQALIVPTMDVRDWGEHQHRLHTRIAPVRAAEYRVPILRVASSGISQLIDRHGIARASAPFDGEGETLAGTLVLGAPGRIPIDRVLARACVLVTFLLLVRLALGALLARWLGSRSNTDPPPTSDGLSST